MIEISFDITDEQRPVVGYFEIDAKKNELDLCFLLLKSPGLGSIGSGDVQ